MEAIGIVASSIAICQAGDRVLSLVSRFKRFLSAPEEIEALAREIDRLKWILIAVENVVMLQPPHLSMMLDTLLKDCDKIVLELETVIVSSIEASQRLNGTAQINLMRMSWMKSKTRVEALRQQFRDAISATTLCVILTNS
jgi:Fungal N-terminal domain of STAND proteins